ncbi:Replication termination protein [Bacillus velezensis]|uniref:Replication termination protein n=1 Tax=Bacillus velezensis TaxID=492670 RepID=UPI001E616516|nr:Replication termination protein [Bacillus velezensis]MCD7911091.1 Replication termination protein [Bacillus velezensis]
MKKERNSTGFLLKQKAFLKLYMITMTEQNRLYGEKLFELMTHEFKDVGYKPTRSEIYRALYDLTKDNILKREKVKKEGAKLQELALYKISDMKAASLYKIQLKAELDRCQLIIKKALRDNF